MPHKEFTGFTWDPHGIEPGCAAKMARHMQPTTVEVSLEALAEQVRLGHETYVVQAGINGKPLFSVRVVA